MTIGELISELSRYDPNLPIFHETDHCCSFLSNPQVFHSYLVEWQDEKRVEHKGNVEVLVLQAADDGHQYYWHELKRVDGNGNSRT